MAPALAYKPVCKHALLKLCTVGPLSFVSALCGRTLVTCSRAPSTNTLCLRESTIDVNHTSPQIRVNHTRGISISKRIAPFVSQCLTNEWLSLAGPGSPGTLGYRFPQPLCPVPQTEMLLKNCLGTLSCLPKVSQKVPPKCFDRVPKVTQKYGLVSPVFQKCPKSVSSVSQKCPNSVLQVFEKCPKSVPKVFQKCPRSFPKVFQKCPKRVSKVPQQCPTVFKSAPTVRLSKNVAP